MTSEKTESASIVTERTKQPYDHVRKNSLRLMQRIRQTFSNDHSEADAHNAAAIAHEFTCFEYPSGVKVTERGHVLNMGDQTVWLVPIVLHTADSTIQLGTVAVDLQEQRIIGGTPVVEVVRAMQRVKEELMEQSEEIRTLTHCVELSETGERIGYVNCDLLEGDWSGPVRLIPLPERSFPKYATHWIERENGQTLGEVQCEIFKDQDIILEARFVPFT